MFVYLWALKPPALIPSRSVQRQSSTYPSFLLGQCCSRRRGLLALGKFTMNLRRQNNNNGMLEVKRGSSYQGMSRLSAKLLSTRLSLWPQLQALLPWCCLRSWPQLHSLMLLASGSALPSPASLSLPVLFSLPSTGLRDIGFSS